MRDREMILIIGDVTDLCIPWVGRYLEQHKIPFLQFNLADFPLHAKLTATYHQHRYAAELALPGQPSIDLDTIQSVWYRITKDYVLPNAIPDSQRDFARDECHQMIQGLFDNLHCFWVSHPSRIKECRHKLRQLHLAQELGFEVPQTLVTNDPNKVRAFYDATGGKIIYKVLDKDVILHKDNVLKRPITETVIYTTLIKPYHLEYLDSVHYAPCLFQEYIQTQVDLRITVVGRRIFAAEIHSLRTEQTKHGRNDDLANKPCQPHQLPLCLEQKCVSMVEELGLAYGAIDMILTPEGRYVFLEINPNGEYVWIESLTGLPISEALAEMLIEGQVLNAD